MAFTIRGSVERCLVSFVVHVPHASRHIPSDIRGDILLTDAELEIELERVTDHDVDVLFEPVVELGGVMFLNGSSRLVIDPERFRDDDEEPAAALGAGAVYLKASDGRLLRDPDRYSTMREDLLLRYYDPYAAAFQDCVQDLLTRFGRCLIIDAHSYPEAPLPWEQHPDGDRPQVALGSDHFHTPTDLLDLLGSEVRASGLSVARDMPFSGTYVPMAFYRRARNVTSVMIEIRRDVYRDGSDAGWRETQGMVARLMSKCHDWLIEAPSTDRQS
jgi:N-formylglutamate deformylase